MKISARGGLSHGFFGEYRAFIGLVFESADGAKAALPVLGEGWKLSPKNPKGATWSGNGAALDALKEKLKGFSLTIEPCGWKHCRKQCADAEIDNLAHSIDRGANFTIEIECDDPRQTSMF